MCFLWPYPKDDFISPHLVQWSERWAFKATKRNYFISHQPTQVNTGSSFPQTPSKRPIILPAVPLLGIRDIRKIKEKIALTPEFECVGGVFESSNFWSKALFNNLCLFPAAAYNKTFKASTGKMCPANISILEGH